MPRRHRVLTVALALAALALSAVPAGAAGDAALAKHIIADPLRHGVAASNANAQAYVNYITGIERSATAGAGVTVQVAAEGFNQAGNKTIFMVITLVALHQAGLSTKDTNQQTRLAAKAGASTFCPGATGSAAFINKPVADIPNSHYAVCDAYKGVVAETITTARANVFAFIESTTRSLSTSEFEAAALSQYNALPTSQSSTTSTSGTAVVIGIVGGVVVVGGLLAITLIYRGRRLRRTAAAATALGGPPAGWYVDPLNAQQQRYWNGTTWGPSPSEAAPPPGEGSVNPPVGGADPARLGPTDAPPSSWPPPDAPPPPPPPPFTPEAFPPAAVPAADVPEAEFAVPEADEREQTD